MTALAAKETIYPARPKKDFTLRVKGGVVIYPGAKVAMKDGLLQPITAALALKHFCTATNTSTVDNSGGSDGDVTCPVEFDDPKTLVFCKNHPDTPITSAHIGQDAYAVDDSGVVSADGTNRTRLGTPWIVVGSSDALGQRPGVYVEMDAFADGQQTSLDLSAATELTIASGEIEVTQTVHSIDTEADAASDNLDTISDMVANQLYLFKPANGARTVVIRHAQDNIYCPFGQNISLADAEDWALVMSSSDGTTGTVIAFSTVAANGGGAGALVGLLASLTTTDKSTLVAAINEVKANAIAAPVMQTAAATLVSGTATINTGVAIAAASEVIPIQTVAITGSTNFGSLRELKASRVNGIAGVGTIVIEAVGNDGALDSDAAGAFRVVILTPQT